MSAIFDALNGLIGQISGADYSANNTGSYYQNALNQVAGTTGAGSPLASTYTGEAVAGMRPPMNAQAQNLAAKLASMGITHSGAAKADFGNLGADQSSALAGVIAPFYSNAENIAGNIISQEPGAQNSSYQDALSRFYQAAETAAAGAPVPATQTPQTPGSFYGYQADNPGDTGGGAYTGAGAPPPGANYYSAYG